MRLARLACLLALAACTRAPPSPARGRDATETPMASPVHDAAPPPKDATVDTQETQVTLTSKSSPSAKVGALTLTLLDLIEVAEPRDGKVGRFHRAKLHLEVGTEARDVFLTGETTALGYTLRLHSAGDAQDNPHAPREGIAVIAVKPAP